MRAIAKLTLAAVFPTACSSGDGGGSGSTTNQVLANLPGDSTADGGTVGTFRCGDTSEIAAYCADQGVKPDAGGKVLTVCINDFVYYPPVVTPRQGDVVAWVNVEQCADPNGPPVNVVEGLVSNVLGTGCDTHHEVVTTPDESSIDPADTLNARLCSRFPSIAANPSLPAIPGLAIDPGSCPGHADEAGNEVPVVGNLVPTSETVITATNVFCHKFVNVGAQHYTCLTNVAHTALLHGGIVVLPAQLPALPELPQQPQL